MTFSICIFALLTACQEESGFLTHTVFIKKLERDIRSENTDEVAIKYFDKLIQLKATLEKAEVRVLGFRHVDLPNSKREGSKKLLRQDAEWKKFNRQRVSIKTQLKEHLRSNYSEYSKVTSSRNDKKLRVPLKIKSKGK